MPGHLTYMATVTNLTVVNFSLVKLEAPTVRRFVAAGQEVSTGNEAVPWAADAAEIRTRAFLFRRGATSADDGIGQFYLFQDRNGRVCWSAFNGGSPSYEQRTVGPHINEPLGNIAHVRLHPSDQVEVLGPRYA